MKNWITELCPEIAEWQAEAIEEYHKSAVKLAREAVIAELVAGSGEPVAFRALRPDWEGLPIYFGGKPDRIGAIPLYTADQLAAAVAIERERCAVLVADLSDMRVPASEYAAAIRSGK